jgi:hypothetical protein
VRYLREISLGQRHRMFDQISGASIEFAPTTGANEEQQTRQVRNAPNVNNRAQGRTSFAFSLPRSARRFHAVGPPSVPNGLCSGKSG